MVVEGRPTALGRPPYEGVVDDLSIVYPDSDGEPMAEDDFQLTAMLDAISALRSWFDDREDVYVGGDMLMYYRVNDNTTRVAPDVFVVVGVESRHKRRSWIVWREGLSPAFVMEMASGSTWRRDMRAKRHIYAEMRVTEYWRFDPSGSYFHPSLIGERLIGGEYAEIPLEPDGEGVIACGHSSALGLDLCVLSDGDLRLRDPASGQWLLALREEKAARREAEAALRESEAALRESETAREVEEAARRAAEDELRALREQLRARQSGQ